MFTTVDRNNVQLLSSISVSTLRPRLRFVGSIAEGVCGVLKGVCDMPSTSTKYPVLALELRLLNQIIGLTIKFKVNYVFTARIRAYLMNLTMCIRQRLYRKSRTKFGSKTAAANCFNNNNLATRLEIDRNDCNYMMIPLLPSVA